MRDDPVAALEAVRQRPYFGGTGVRGGPPGLAADDRDGRGEWRAGRRAGRTADNGRETAVAGYVIVEVEITDPDAYAEYRTRVPATLERYGGRFLVRGGAVETLEGGWQPQRIVVLEFPSVERAKEWYTSPEYQEILAIRERHARSRALIIEGV
jgi:uncharacterized protein (DUF1330 family)